MAADARLWRSVGVAPEELRLRLPRLGSEVRAQAIGNGPTVVFVHGASNAGSSWVDLVTRLSGFRCVVVDRPGCGLSPKLSRDTTDVAGFGAAADDFVVDVFDALGVESGSAVVTSFGGFFGLRGAAAHPDRIERLVALGFSIGVPPVYLPLVMRVGSLPRLSAITARMPTPKFAIRGMLKQIGLRAAVESGAFNDEMIRWFQALLTTTDTMRNEITNSPRVITMRGGNPALYLQPDLLARITSPALFLWGRDDPFGGEDVAMPFVAQIPNAMLEMVNGGHAVWIDDADGIAARVQEFLS